LSAIDSDPEIRAMQAVLGHLGPLEQAARQRVLEWAAGRFGLQVGFYIPEEPPPPAETLERTVPRYERAS